MTDNGSIDVFTNPARISRWASKRPEGAPFLRSTYFRPLGRVPWRRPRCGGRGVESAIRTAVTASAATAGAAATPPGATAALSGASERGRRRAAGAERKERAATGDGARATGAVLAAVLTGRRGAQERPFG